MNEKNRTLLLLHLAVFLAGIALIVLSVWLQTRRVRRRA